MLVGFQNQGFGVIIVYMHRYRHYKTKNVTKLFSTRNISPNYSVTIDSTPPRPRHPYEAFLCDDLHRAHYGTSSHVEAISHPATLRGQRQDVYSKLMPQSLCMGVRELCRGSAAQLAKGGNDCATLSRCPGDGTCATHALLNGLKRLRNQVRLDKHILPGTYLVPMQAKLLYY